MNIAGKDDESLEEILHEILQRYPETVSFSRGDADSIPEAVDTLTVVAVTTNLLALREFGGRLGPQRSQGLVQQVIGAAFQSFGGVDPHPHAFQKAAMLLRGIIQGHPFSDGNKRTGFLLAMYYLSQRGYHAPQPLPRSEVVEFCLEISAGKIRDVEVMADRLCDLWHCPHPPKRSPSKRRSNPTPTKSTPPRPVGRRTTKGRRLADALLEAAKEIRRHGGIEDVFHRLVGV